MIDRILSEVPDKPGCYIYKNGDGKIIYIGKAKNLKKRMSSYFNRVHNIKTTKLVSEIMDFSYIVTTNERESLILENNLIKEHSPRYNIMLKDDKTYPYIVITNEVEPRILKVRDRKFRGTYYGPYPSNSFVNNVVQLINRETKLRQCHKIPKETCVYYHLNQCYGPCIKEFSTDEVKVYKEEVASLLRDDMYGLKRLILSKIKSSAKNMEFEKAQELKEILDQTESFKDRQAIELDGGHDFDVVGIYMDKSWVSIAIINVVGGIVHNINMSIHSYIEDYKSVVISYLYEYYEQKKLTKFVCEDELLREMIKNIFIAEPIVSHLKEYRNLEQMTIDNAREYYKNNVDKLTKLVMDDSKTGFEELKILTKSNLELIEMYDISHHAGDGQVGAKIAYLNGQKQTKLYRKYKIKSAAKMDEYGSMREVLDRRIRRMINDSEQVPTLIILDGGKGQINICIEILKKYSVLDDIMVIGLVKDEKHTTRAIMNKSLKQMPLDRSSKLYKFLYQMQEEVHRFAIDFHHKSVSNSMVMSKLDNIAGLGPKRKKLLMEKFTNISNIKNASYQELKALKIPDNVINELHKIKLD